VKGKGDTLIREERKDGPPIRGKGEKRRDNLGKAGEHVVDRWKKGALTVFRKRKEKGNSHRSSSMRKKAEIWTKQQQNGGAEDFSSNGEGKKKSWCARREERN